MCGLADASLYWYNRVKDIVIRTGGTMFEVDPAVFYWLDKDCTVTGVLACHVDDLGRHIKFLHNSNTSSKIHVSSWA